MISLPLAQPGGASPCDACLAGCCRGLSLFILGADAWRIGRDLALPLERFAELGWCDPASPGSVILDPAEPDHAFRLQLVQVDDASQPGFGERCVFLVTLGDVARCAIYQSRPAMCRTYPTRLHGEELTADGGPYCPPGAWRLDVVDAPLALAQHRFKRRLAALDERLAQTWTAALTAGGARRAPADYFRYLEQAYGALERREPGWLRAPEEGDLERAASAPADEAPAEAVDRLLAELRLP